MLNPLAGLTVSLDPLGPSPGSSYFYYLGPGNCIVTYNYMMEDGYFEVGALKSQLKHCLLDSVLLFMYLQLLTIHY
jgi:hypothetical protein